jgi:CBS domain-containing protein
MTARDAMTPAPLTVTPRTSVAAALRLARDNGIRHLPVVERGRILGVVRQQLLERAVEPALTLPAGMSLAAAARLLLECGAHEALVTEDDRLVGILTHADLLRALVLDEPEAVA